jgi:hypothetical protein
MLATPIQIDTETLPLWKRAALVCFLVHIMFIYPTINRIDENALGNRIVLILLLGWLVFAFGRRWADFLSKPWDLATGLLMSYLIFIFVSTLTSIAFGIQSPRSLLTYGLNSFAPIILYGCFVRFPARQFLIRVILIFTAINIVFGALTFSVLGINLSAATTLLQGFVFDPEAHRLGSLIGKSTVLGYMALFSFSWVLFFFSGKSRYLLLLFFGAAVVLSFQRSMWAGLVMVMAAYFLSPSSGMRLKDLVVFALIVPSLTAMVFVMMPADALAKLLTDRLAEFNPTDALNERGSQQLILNTEKAGQIIFGEGYGKYSPLNKSENVLNLPDAPYHLIFNETGLIGLIAFVGMLIAFFLRALSRNNIFQCWFVAHLALALVGSRILWYFPLNFIVLMLLATFKDDRDDISPSTWKVVAQ